MSTVADAVVPVAPRKWRPSRKFNDENEALLCTEEVNDFFFSLVVYEFLYVGNEENLQVPRSYLPR